MGLWSILSYGCGGVHAGTLDPSIPLHYLPPVSKAGDERPHKVRGRCAYDRGMSGREYVSVGHDTARGDAVIEIETEWETGGGGASPDGWTAQCGGRDQQRYREYVIRVVW